MREDYKGYVIDTHPQQLSGTEEWTVNVTIERHHGDHVNTRSFSAGKPNYKTEEEAIMASTDFGECIINGLFKTLDVSDL